MTEHKKIDIVNFFLIWITLGIAFIFPFELFLFSYAVLGPLHYLTEINWLEKKNYFLKTQTDKKTYLLLVIVALCILSTSFFIPELNKWDITRTFFLEIEQSVIYKPLTGIIAWGNSMLFIGLFSSIVYFITEKWINRILLFSLCVLISIFLINYPFFTIFCGVFLPSLIHVFLFTVLFMWSGSKRSNSGWGYVNVISMILVVFFIIGKEIPQSSISVSRATLDTLILSNFHILNFALNKLLGLADNPSWSLITVSARKAQIFIAFAYTYHYLNWFSKTSVINWYKVDRKKMGAAIVIWIASVILYYINYRLGFAALFVLSILHVILEFPLNVNSVISLMRPHTQEVKNTKAPLTPATPLITKKEKKRNTLASGK